VPETKQVVILRFEQPHDRQRLQAARREFGRTGAGLIARMAVHGSIVWVDKRVLDVDI
jgi:membrane protease subunit HflC